MNFYHQLFGVSISCIQFHSISDFFLCTRGRGKLRFHYFGIDLTSKFCVTGLFANCMKTGERTNLDELPPRTLLHPFLYLVFFNAPPLRQRGAAVTELASVCSDRARPSRPGAL